MDTRGVGSLVTLMISLMGGASPCGSENNHYRYNGYQAYHYPVKANESTHINAAISDEQRLLDHIMRGYERSVRPVKNASSAVVIQMGLTLAQVFDMDEKNQVLITNVWLDHEWVDEFLVWDPVDFNNITKIRIPCHKIWLPDMVLYNNAAEYTDGLMPANAMVNPNGNIFWPVPTKLQSSCKVDVTYFPFDIQECALKFGSWTYDGYQVDITNRTSEVDLSNYVINGEWELLKVRCVRNVVRYACCPEPFPDVTFYIKIRRRTLFYMYNVVFPCVMMSALTLLVFCLPPDSGEKIALGITVLLAFSVFMLAVAENLPETSEFVPLISIYLTIVMALTSMSVIMTVFVLNLHHRGPYRHAVPNWLRQIFLGYDSKHPQSRSALPRTTTGNNKCGSKSKSQQQQHNNYNDVRYSGISGHDDESRFRNMTLRMTLEGLIQELREDYQLENGLFERDIVANSQSHSSHAYNSNTCSVSMPSPASNATTEIRMDSNRSSPSPKSHKKKRSGSSSSSAGPRQNHTPAVVTTAHTQQPPSSGISAPCTPINHQLLRNQQSSPSSWAGSQSARTLLTSSSPSSRQQQHRPPTKTKTPYEEALLSVTKLLERHDHEEREYDDMQDWRRLAQTVDRILFVFFLIATVISTMTILVIIPSTQDEG